MSYINRTMSHMIDWTTLERTVYQRELIGTFVAPDSTKHDLYRIQYVFGENIPAGSYTAHNVGLSDCYILSANFSLYRTDSPGVINLSNDYEAFQVVFTNNGDTIRFINRLASAQTNATVVGTIECYKRAAQS